MSIPGSASPLFLASTAAAGAYDIPRSLRFNSGDSSYLNRTPSSAGNRKTWTYSFWIKYCGGSGINGATSTWILWGGANTTNFAGAYFNANSLRVFQYNGSGYDYQLDTTQVFRDQSAWYHFVIACDTTQATASNRIKVYVNGQEITTFSTSTYPTQNLDTHINSATQQNLGGGPPLTSYLSGYMADIHFIDGQALSASDFGEYDDSNVWQPIKYAGTYGTNGFKLDFSDTSSDSALGTDSSGAGNNFSVNNLNAAGSAWYNSQTWSDVLYTAGTPSDAPTVTAKSFLSGYPATLPFNGNTNRGSNETYAAETLKTIVFRPGTALTGVTKLEIYTNGAYTTDAGYNSATSVITSNTNVGWQTLYDGTAITLNYVWAYKNNGQGAFSGLKINGLMLVDASVSDPLAVGIDALRDSPVNGDSANDTGAGGEITGNYCTWNPLDRSSTNLAISNGNLDIASDNNNNYAAMASFEMISGKWYWEATCGTVGAYTQASIGINDSYVFTDGFTYYSDNGNKNSSTSYGSAFNTAGTVVGIAFDSDVGTLTFYRNGVSQGVAFTVDTTRKYRPFHFAAGSTPFSFNFGQRAFAYAAPSGYKSLNTSNLSSTIADGSTAFDTKTFTANNGTQTISGFNFSPGLAWTKSRANAYAHQLWDQVRGENKALMPNETSVEANLSGSLAFTSDGFTSSTNNNANYGSGGSVAWAWDAGSSTVTNTDGSISSQVRANPSAGFSIVSWTGTGSAATIGHGLNAAPSMLIQKFRSATSSWGVFHKSLSSGTRLQLNTTDAATTSGGSYVNVGSSTFDVHSGNNDSGVGMIAYCFAPVEGYSAFGSYTGNGSADGPFVYTGFRPRFVMTKASSASGLWNLHDTERSNSNPASKLLWADSSSSEVDYAGGDFTIDCLSNGFKARASTSSLNSSGVTYIYIAFAEHPFKTARAR